MNHVHATQHGVLDINQPLTVIYGHPVHGVRFTESGFFARANQIWSGRERLVAGRAELTPWSWCIREQHPNVLEKVFKRRQPRETLFYNQLEVHGLWGWTSDLDR